MANLLCRPLKLGRLIVLFPWQLTLFQSHPLDFNMLLIFSWKIQNGATNSRKHIYMTARSCIRGTICTCKYENGTLKVARNAFNNEEVWNPVCCHGSKTFKPVLWSAFSRILLQRIEYF